MEDDTRQQSSDRMSAYTNTLSTLSAASNDESSHQHHPDSTQASDHLNPLARQVIITTFAQGVAAPAGESDPPRSVPDIVSPVAVVTAVGPQPVAREPQTQHLLNREHHRQMCSREVQQESTVGRFQASGSGDDLDAGDAAAVVDAARTAPGLGREPDPTTPPSHSPLTPPAKAPPNGPDCAICLQSCVHPVRLPCRHIFCFLCAKGAAKTTRRCAMCRSQLPDDYLEHPELLDTAVLERELAFQDGYQWFYEGWNGWWKYDERTSAELESAFSAGQKRAELLVAGFRYVVDFDAMLQVRRSDPARRRRVKRDLASVAKKGVAGIRLSAPARADAEEVTASLQRLTLTGPQDGDVTDAGDWPQRQDSSGSDAL